MAKRPAGEKPQLPAPTKTNREKIVEAFMAILAEKRFEEIGFREIAARCGLSLAECRSEFSSTLWILAAQTKETDRKVLEGGDADMAEEPPRERLFDVLMRRLEILSPHRAAIRSLMRSAGTNPGLACALNGLAVRSQQWMLTAADIDAAPRAWRSTTRGCCACGSTTTTRASPVRWQHSTASSRTRIAGPASSTTSAASYRRAGCAEARSGAGAAAGMSLVKSRCGPDQDAHSAASWSGVPS
jgi:AcrR family transcriptional regulator